MLRFGMWKGKQRGEKHSMFENQICKFQLISNDKNHSKFNNFCFDDLKFVKQPPCTLPCWRLSNSTKNIMRGSIVWEG
jgi:hypothetical protein